MKCWNTFTEMFSSLELGISVQQLLPQHFMTTVLQVRTGFFPLNFQHWHTEATRGHILPPTITIISYPSKIISSWAQNVSKWAWTDNRSKTVLSSHYSYKILQVLHNVWVFPLTTMAFTTTHYLCAIKMLSSQVILSLQLLLRFRNSFPMTKILCHFLKVG